MEDFFEEKEIKEAKEEFEKQKDTVPEKINEMAIVYEEEGDDNLLQRLMQANEEIDKI